MDVCYVLLEFLATGRSLVQRSHTECDVSNKCVRGESKRRPRTSKGFSASRKYSNIGLSSIGYFCHFATFEILTAVLLIFEVFCGVTPCYWASNFRLSE